MCIIASVATAAAVAPRVRHVMYDVFPRVCTSATQRPRRGTGAPGRQSQSGQFASACRHANKTCDGVCLHACTFVKLCTVVHLLRNAMHSNALCGAHVRDFCRTRDVCLVWWSWSWCCDAAQKVKRERARTSDQHHGNSTPTITAAQGVTNPYSPKMQRANERVHLSDSPSASARVNGEYML